MVGLTYAFLGILLLLVLPISVSELPATDVLSSWASYATVVAALLTAFVLRREIRRDLHQLCVFWILVGAILSMITFFSTHTHPWIGWPAFVGCASAWVASVALLVRDAVIADKVPSQMLRHFDASEVYEVSGVQLVAEIADTDKAARGDVEVRLHLQNCWDRERTVKAKLSPRTGLLGTPGGARFSDAESTVTLAPGAFGVWTLPAELTTTEGVTIFVDLEVTGLDGRRVYKRRVQSLPARVSRLVTVLVAVASLGNQLVWGGGLRLAVPAGKRSANGPAPRRRWAPLP